MLNASAQRSLPSPQAAQNVITVAETIFNTDFTSAGFGGMRGVGTGTIALSGVSGPVTKALLYWHGPTASADPTANASVTFAGTTVTGANIGFSDSNCWGFLNSQAYRADVTALVTGNGSYALSNFRKPDAEINGVSLIVFFNDGDSANNRDVIILHGNDSNISNSFDPDGWSASVSGVNYVSGSASLQFHVADGQSASEDGLILNGGILEPAGAIFSGDSVPRGDGCCPDGGLWDIRPFDITSFLTPGPNDLTLTLTTSIDTDCLGLIVLLVDLPAGAAPMAFDLCVQDDSNGNILSLNSTTGNYQFTNCRGVTVGGTGALIRKGCGLTLQHNAPDRRVLAKVDTCVKKGTASVQVFSSERTFTITDRNTANNTCACAP